MDYDHIFDFFIGLDIPQLFRLQLYEPRLPFWILGHGNPHIDRPFTS